MSMEMRKILDFTFVNETKNSRNGFSHVSHVLYNGHEIGYGKVNYLNRTWEYYRYQTSMTRAMDNLIESRLDDLKFWFMNEKGYGKLTADRRKEFEAYAEKDETLNNYYQIRNELRKED